jgi:glutathione peroxidase
MTPGMIDQTVEQLEGGQLDLAAQRGKVLLIVNTASECGFTPQYGGLEKLYQAYKDKGLVIIGFPSNDFGGQEPGTAADIKTFCQRNYGVTFPMMAKVHAKGKDIAPVYQALSGAPGFSGEVKWNFTKFLVDKTGKVVGRFEPNVTPDSPELAAAIEKHL